MRFSRVSLALAAIVLLVPAVLTGCREDSIPLAISHIAAVNQGNGPALLRMEGSGFAQRLDTLLVPLPSVHSDESLSLVPRTSLNDVSCDGELGVATARGRRLVTIEVREDRAPRILGSLKVKRALDMPGGGISALVQIGKQAVVGLTSSAGLVLVDLSDPAEPREIADLPLPDAATDMRAANGRIYVATRNGLWQVTIDGNRLQAEQIPAPARPWRLALAGNRLAVISLDKELLLYELGGAALPRLVGRERLPQSPRGVSLGADALHLILADGALYEYSVADWPRVRPRHRLQLPGRPLSLLRGDNPPLLFCSLAGTGVCVIEIGRAGGPTVAGWLSTGSPATDLAVIPGRLLTSGKEGLRIHRIDKLRNRRLQVESPLKTSYERVRLLAWQGEGFATDGTTLVALDDETAPLLRAALPSAGPGLLAVPGNNEVMIYARPAGRGTMLVPRARVPVAGRVTETLLREGRLYALSENALQIFAIDPAGGYRSMGTLDGFGSAHSLAWAGPNFLLVGDRHRGVAVVSVKDAAVPRIVAEERVPAFMVKGNGGIQDVLVTGQLAFVARGDLGVQIFDLSRLPELQIIRQIDTPGIARHLAFSDGLLLVADRGRGIQVIDTQAGEYRQLATIPVLTHAESFIVTDTALMLANAAGAVMRLPLPRRLNGIRFDRDGEATGALPGDLPAGNYRLVLHEGERVAGADFTLN